jgi:hypothetical protein
MKGIRRTHHVRKRFTYCFDTGADRRNTSVASQQKLGLLPQWGARSNHCSDSPVRTIELSKGTKATMNRRAGMQASPSLRIPATATFDQLKEDLRMMKNYLMMCLQKEDRYGVMDASVDVREIVVKLSNRTRRRGLP